MWGVNDRGGGPFVLAERNAWLREIASDQLRDPERYWARLTSSRPTSEMEKQTRQDWKEWRATHRDD